MQYAILIIVFSFLNHCPCPWLFLLQFMELAVSKFLCTEEDGTEQITEQNQRK